MAEFKLNNKKEGQLLIEAMVAVSLLMVGMLGIFNVLSQSLGLNRVAADQYIATNLASEGIEIVKNMIDMDFAQGSGFGTSVAEGLDKYCPIDFTTTALEGCNPNPKNPNYIKCEGCGKGGVAEYGASGNPTKFRRYVYIQKLEIDIIEVESVVEWTGRGGISFDVKLVDRFYNWRGL